MAISDIMQSLYHLQQRKLKQLPDLIDKHKDKIVVFVYKPANKIGRNILFKTKSNSQHSLPYFLFMVPKQRLSNSNMLNLLSLVYKNMQGRSQKVGAFLSLPGLNDTINMSSSLLDVYERQRGREGFLEGSLVLHLNETEVFGMPIYEDTWQQSQYMPRNAVWVRDLPKNHLLKLKNLGIKTQEYKVHQQIPCFIYERMTTHCFNQYGLETHLHPECLDAAHFFKTCVSINQFVGQRKKYFPEEYVSSPCSRDAPHSEEVF